MLTSHGPRRILATTAAGACALSLALAVSTGPTAEGASGGPALAATTPAARLSLSVTPKQPILGEWVTTSGRISTRVVRPISIQVFRRGTWQTVVLGRTDVKGNYKLRLRVVSKFQIRILARQIIIRKHHYPKQTSSHRMLTPVAQKATDLNILPPISQPGGTPAKAENARSVIWSAFTPVRPGRSGIAQRLVGHSWVDLAPGTEDASGRVQIAVPQSPKAATYRIKLAGAGGAGPISSPARNTKTAIGPLEFEDQFERTRLGSHWMYMDPEYDGAPNRKCSKGSPRAVTLDGHTVSLSVMLDPQRLKQTCRAYGRANQYRLNGEISTRNWKQFRYGFFSARIKFNKLRGEHSAFWLYGVQANRKTEVDVAEWFGKETDTMANNIYVFPRGKKRKKYGGKVSDLSSFLTGKGDSWFGRYHVFTVQWTPKQYVFRIDGRESFRTAKGNTNAQLFLWLSALSGDYELHFNPASALPQVMKVDWVRVWALPARR